MYIKNTSKLNERQENDTFNFHQRLPTYLYPKNS